MKKRTARILPAALLLLLLFGCAAPAADTVYHFPNTPGQAVLQGTLIYADGVGTAQQMGLPEDGGSTSAVSVPAGGSVTLYYELAGLGRFAAVAPIPVSAGPQEHNDCDRALAGLWPGLTFGSVPYEDGRYAFLTVTDGSRAYDIRWLDGVKFDGGRVIYTGTSGTVPAAVTQEELAEYLAALDIAAFFER